MPIDFKIEQEILKKGYKGVCGIDEAGRGPLAGPVVAVCAMMRQNFDYSQVELDLIKDSKQITEKRREYLQNFIFKNFFIGIGVVDHDEIDRINILQATFLAMNKAIEQLEGRIDYILIDGKLLIPNLNIRQTAIVKGDAKVLSIAAASIIAKTLRDKIMKKYSIDFPGYFFDKHKGYGTKKHKEVLLKYGACPIHRKSFAPVKKILKAC